MCQVSQVFNVIPIPTRGTEGDKVSGAQLLITPWAPVCFPWACRKVKPPGHMISVVQEARDSMAEIFGDVIHSQEAS